MMAPCSSASISADRPTPDEPTVFSVDSLRALLRSDFDVVTLDDDYPPHSVGRVCSSRVLARKKPRARPSRLIRRTFCVPTKQSTRQFRSRMSHQWNCHGTSELPSAPRAHRKPAAAPRRTRHDGPNAARRGRMAGVALPRRLPQVGLRRLLCRGYRNWPYNPEENTLAADCSYSIAFLRQVMANVRLFGPLGVSRRMRGGRFFGLSESQIQPAL